MNEPKTLHPTALVALIAAALAGMLLMGHVLNVMHDAHEAAHRPPTEKEVREYMGQYLNETR